MTRAPEILEQLAAPGWRGFSLLRRYRAAQPAQAKAIARLARGVDWSRRDDFEGRRVRYAFVGSASAANLEDALMLEALDRGVIPVQYHSPSRQISRELRDPDSPLDRQQPDVVVVAASAPHLTGAGASAAPRYDQAARVVDALVDDLRLFRSRSAATLIVHTVMAPEFCPLGLQDWREREGALESYARLNLGLVERCREIPDVQVVDLARLLALSGASWWTLHRGWFLANLGVPEETALLLGREYAAVGAALRGLVRKCLVVDLDDTIWGGVVGEVGAENVQIGAEYPGSIYGAIQRIVRQLHDRGILLAINSHNNEADAHAPFHQRPEMLLALRDFSASRINWQDKATNLQELAAELRLGLDSFVLLDNDPVQRAWVEERLPEVYVLQAEDPLDMLRALACQRLFDGLARTADDQLRASSYAAASRRRADEAAAVDRERFLAGLGLELRVGRPSAAELPRLAQLAQRTNQFNLTTRRYTEGQLHELCAAPDATVLSCSCRDRFAGEGIVGLVILRGAGPEWVVDTFLLSCRVLGRGIERALAAATCRVAAARGATALLGEYRRTERNAIAAGFYRDVGFAAVEEDEERAVWRLPLPAANDPAPSWIRLEMEGEAR